MNSRITLALTKGRVLRDELNLLDKIGIVPSEDIDSSRKLVFDTNQKQLHLMILRGMDVATYVEHGIADLGMVGKDVLLEQGEEGYYEPLDLNLGICNLVVAGLSGEDKIPRRIKVATKYTNIAKRYYAEKGIQVDIIKLYGGMELAPITGLAHRIVDIVETGNTLKAHGLIALEEIAPITTRLIVNKVAMKMKFIQISKLIESMRDCVNK